MYGLQRRLNYEKLKGNISNHAVFLRSSLNHWNLDVRVIKERGSLEDPEFPLGTGNLHKHSVAKLIEDKNSNHYGILPSIVRCRRILTLLLYQR